MTAMTPLEQALQAWNRDRTRDEVERRQTQLDDATALNEWAVFSNRQIALITGLPLPSVAHITGKRDNTGGRLNPESLPFILDVRLVWAREARVDRDALGHAVGAGTSCGMVSKLTGVPRTTLYQKMKEQS